jgi:hypothetical protein
MPEPSLDEYTADEKTAQEFARWIRPGHREPDRTVIGRDNQLEREEAATLPFRIHDLNNRIQHVTVGSEAKTVAIGKHAGLVGAADEAWQKLATASGQLVTVQCASDRHVSHTCILIDA